MFSQWRRGRRLMASLEAWLTALAGLMGALRHVDGVMHLLTTAHVHGVGLQGGLGDALLAAALRRQLSRRHRYTLHP